LDFSFPLSFSLSSSADWATMMLDDTASPATVLLAPFLQVFPEFFMTLR
jgi:hypothetical protein